MDRSTRGLLDHEHGITGRNLRVLFVAVSGWIGISTTQE